MILIPDYLIYAMWSALCLIAVTVRVLHYAYVARRSVMFFVIGKNIAQVVTFGCVAYAIRYPESGAMLRPLRLWAWLVALLFFVGNVWLNWRDLVVAAERNDRHIAE